MKKVLFCFLSFMLFFGLKNLRKQEKIPKLINTGFTGLKSEDVLNGSRFKVKINNQNKKNVHLLNIKVQFEAILNLTKDTSLTFNYITSNENSLQTNLDAARVSEKIISKEIKVRTFYLVEGYEKTIDEEAFYFCLDEFTLSPDLFLKTKGKVVTSELIKGASMLSIDEVLSLTKKTAPELNYNYLFSLNNLVYKSVVLNMKTGENLKLNFDAVTLISHKFIPEVICYQYEKGNIDFQKVNYVVSDYHEFKYLVFQETKFQLDKEKKYAYESDKDLDFSLKLSTSPNAKVYKEISKPTFIILFIVIPSLLGGGFIVCITCVIVIKIRKDRKHGRSRISEE